MRGPPPPRWPGHSHCPTGPGRQTPPPTASAIRANAQPLSANGWIGACQRAGLTVQHHGTGPMALLAPQRIAQEEGMPTLITIGWNVLPRPLLRDRILAMGQVFHRHADHLGYIVLFGLSGGASAGVAD